MNQKPAISSEHNAQIAYRPDIDGLRAVAILSVLFYHATPDWVTGGFVGVDVFFVISGYLISSIIFKSLVQNDFSFSEFYIHRTLRIFPPLIIVLAFCFIVGWFALLPDEFKQLGKHIAAGAGFVENINIWLEAGYFDAETEKKPLMHLWSLAIEEQYYIIFPIFAWAAWRRRLKTFIVMICLVSFFANIYCAYFYDPKLAFLSPISRLWELLLGGYLSLVSSRPCFAGKIIPKKFLSPLGLLLIVVSVCVFDKKMTYPGWPAILPAAGAALLIAGGPEGWLSQQLLANRFMVLVGRVSYPLYLWHWPLLSLPLVISGEKTAGVSTAFALAGSFILALCSYCFIENPIRYGQSRRTLKAVCLIFMMMVLGFAGYNIFKRDGLEFRVKSILGNNAQFHFRDVPDSYAFLDNCLVRFSGFSGGCMQVHNRPPNVVLFGDSHSLNLFHGLADLTLDDKKINILNLRRDSAFFMSGVGTHGRDTDLRNQNEFQETLTITDQAMRIIERSGTIEVAIILLRGSDYFEESQKTIRMPTHPEHDDNRSVWLTSLDETVSHLLEINKKVIVFMDWPTLDFDPKICVANRGMQVADFESACAMSRDRIETREAEFKRLAMSVLSAHPQVTVFDSIPYFCDAKNCFAKHGNDILYSDPGHLSLNGGRYIGQRLLPVIRASLSQ